MAFSYERGTPVRNLSLKWRLGQIRPQRGPRQVLGPCSRTYESLLATDGLHVGACDLLGAMSDPPAARDARGGSFGVQVCVVGVCEGVYTTPRYRRGHYTMWRGFGGICRNQATGSMLWGVYAEGMCVCGKGYFCGKGFMPES